MIIITKSELNIDGVTLLSVEEFNSLRHKIPVIEQDWWLRSPDDIFVNSAACVDDGSVYDNHVEGTLGVRPALILSNLGSSKLDIGDKFLFGGGQFTIVSYSYALCDNIIGKSAFREDWRADNANEYDASDVKKYVDRWFQNALEADKGGSRCR